MNHSYDVAVIGGGPAGAATAITLCDQSDLSVAIIERSAYERARVGETIPPQARSLLEALGVWQPFLADNHLPAYGSSSRWGSAALDHNDFIYSPYGQGWHLDRRRFDAMLAAEAEKKGAALFRSTKLLAHDRLPAGGWRLQVESEVAGSQTLEAAFVVDASGRRAAFARRQGARQILHDQLLGAFVFFKFEGSLPANANTLVETWEEGWWYSALLPNAGMAVACMSDADIVKRHGLKQPGAWQRCLRTAAHTRDRLQGAVVQTAPSIHVAHSRRLDTISGDGWVAVGDAASTFDPLSSHGIVKALDTAIRAARAALLYFQGDHRALQRYSENYEKCERFLLGIIASLSSARIPCSIPCR